MRDDRNPWPLEAIALTIALVAFVAFFAHDWTHPMTLVSR